jgi:TonB-linked SusC/RagA family outer membrane protein
VGTASADVDLFKMVGFESKNHSLHYNINLSYSNTNAKDQTWIASWIQSNRVYLDKSNERLTKARRQYTDALIENTLTYEGHFGQHNVNLVVGQTYEEEHTDLLTAWGNNLSEPYFLQLQNASTRDASSYEYQHGLASYIGRLNYNFGERYLISGVIRRDGSSRLSKNIRWGTFPSVSAGWRIDKEKFFKVDPQTVNLLKLRASYGVLGNENIGEYQYMATMNRNNMTYSFGNQVVTGSSISTFVNENIAWEKKKSTNVGIDIAMFNNRFEFTAEWYKNRSEDLLYSVPVPTQAGVANGTVTMNAASMNNSGFEFSATYRNHDHALKYDISANLSTLSNKVTSLGFGTDYYLTGNYMTYVGQELGQFYGYVYEGIARTQEDLDNHPTQQGANVGDCLYKDLNGDGVINTEDRTVLGSGLAKINFGLNAHLEYKGFDLSISTYGALNYHVTDDIYNSLNSCYGWANKDVNMLDANQFDANGSYISKNPRTYATNMAEMGWNDLFSERQIQNAAYWKLANIELGYNMPDKWFGGVVTGARIYVSAQNLYTLTGYKGYNVDYAGGTFTPGYNFCSFPTPRSFMAGVHFTF